VIVRGVCCRDWMIVLQVLLAELASFGLALCIVWFMVDWEVMVLEEVYCACSNPSVAIICCDTSTRTIPTRTDSSE